MAEIKKSSPPTKTFGWLRGLLNLETKKPKEIKIKGRKTTVQEKYKTKKLFRFIKTIPLRAKEIKIIPAKERKNVWVMEKTVSLLSLNLKPFLVNLFLLSNIQ